PGRTLSPREAKQVAGSGWCDQRVLGHNREAFERSLELGDGDGERQVWEALQQQLLQSLLAFSAVNSISRAGGPEHRGSPGMGSRDAGSLCLPAARPSDFWLR
ncbi:unnamed protein product, partial [Rangifer tarandus platyrhynchus]